MSNLIKVVEVPDNVREVSLCPAQVEIYEDHVTCVGGQGQTCFFRDYTGITSQAASIFCGFASIIFITAVNAANHFQNGAAILQDTNRLNFCSGLFSYKNANVFTYELFQEIQEVFIAYKSKPEISPVAHGLSITSPADELKKMKELLDIGAITQDEFDAKKKQLLSL